jgi:hypothetical protein
MGSTSLAIINGWEQRYSCMVNRIGFMKTAVYAGFFYPDNARQVKMLNAGLRATRLRLC